MLRFALLLVGVCALASPLSAQANFIRGDANNDAAVDIADAIFAANSLFVGGSPAPECIDAADANDDGLFNIADVISIANFLFLAGSPPPPAPFPDCGPDPTDDTLTCVGPVAGCPMMTCVDLADCPAGFYCEKAIGDCDGMGVCMPIPDICTAIFDPVCGCDGMTYGNACEAAANGVSIAFEGECLPVGACFDNSDCTAAQFCFRPTGPAGGPDNCNDVGTCMDTPFICTFIFDPHCGCDGVTYDNECVAWANGTSAAFQGNCP